MRNCGWAASDDDRRQKTGGQEKQAGISSASSSSLARSPFSIPPSFSEPGSASYSSVYVCTLAAVEEVEVVVVVVVQRANSGKSQLHRYD